MPFRERRRVVIGEPLHHGKSSQQIGIIWRISCKAMAEAAKAPEPDGGTEELATRFTDGYFRAANCAPPSNVSDAGDA